MDLPEDLRYARTHEWVRASGEEAVIGITDYAQEQLGDITFVQLPDAGEDVHKGAIFGAIESVKTRSDLYAPLSGKVAEVNDALDENPEIVNEDPYGDGWLVKVSLSDLSELGDLMSAEQYRDFLEEAAEKE